MSPSFEALQKATADLEPPYAVLDADALRSNADDLVRRAGGKPIRLASKSVRSRHVIREVLERPGWQGILAYTLPEALWLAAEHGDIVVGYPSVDREALLRLANSDELTARVTVMVDSEEHLDLILSVVGRHGPRLRVCLDLDASLRVGAVHLGMRRSPTHSTEDARTLARAVLARPRFHLVGLMSYEGQIAGLGDNPPGLRRFGVRSFQAVSGIELARRRARVVRAVLALAPLDFVNGGGTGSLEYTSRDRSVTELAAGSGLLAPVLFDSYTRFRPTPAAYFVLPVVRRPSPDHATLLGGGWIASGPYGADRLPTPVWPPGLKLLRAEGAGEVQTPVTGEAARDLRIGDRVWFRHAKAGEVCEHVDELHLVEGGRIIGTAATYRGEGKTFL